jgi:uncharacterized membrane protein
VFRRQKGESVAKAETPPKADSLDEQISALLESIEVDGKGNHSPEQPVQEEAPARPRRSLRRASNGSKSTPARPPARKKAKKAPARHKAAPVAKKAAPPRRKPPPARRAVRTRPRAQAHSQAPARARRPARRQLFADPATRELAFFVIAGLMIGAFVGVLFALAG